jgi:hypothetical protein
MRHQRRHPERLTIIAPQHNVFSFLKSSFCNNFLLDLTYLSVMSVSYDRYDRLPTPERESQTLLQTQTLLQRAFLLRQKSTGKTPQRKSEGYLEKKNKQSSLGRELAENPL